jgi:hypothetical protein
VLWLQVSARYISQQSCIHVFCIFIFCALSHVSCGMATAHSLIALCANEDSCKAECLAGETFGFSPLSLCHWLIFGIFNGLIFFQIYINLMYFKFKHLFISCIPNQFLSFRLYFHFRNTRSTYMIKDIKDYYICTLFLLLSSVIFNACCLSCFSSLSRTAIVCSNCSANVRDFIRVAPTRSWPQIPRRQPYRQAEPAWVRSDGEHPGERSGGQWEAARVYLPLLAFFQIPILRRLAHSSQQAHRWFDWPSPLDDRCSKEVLKVTTNQSTVVYIL